MVPEHIFLPIDYGETRQDLRLKPRRAGPPPTYPSRKMSIGSLLNPFIRSLGLSSVMGREPQLLTPAPLSLPEGKEEEELLPSSPTPSEATTVLCDPFWYLEEGLPIQVITGSHYDQQNVFTDEGEEYEYLYGEQEDESGDSEEDTDEEDQEYLRIIEAIEHESGYAADVESECESYDESEDPDDDLRLPPICWDGSGPRSQIRSVEVLPSIRELFDEPVTGPSHFTSGGRVPRDLGPSLMAQCKSNVETPFSFGLY